MQLSFLRPLYDRPGPWCSVYVDASADTEDAHAALALRWRALARQLTDQGADEATVAALEGPEVKNVAPVSPLEVHNRLVEGLAGVTLLVSSAMFLTNMSEVEDYRRRRGEGRSRGRGAARA